jgi:hypothetical protein
MDFEHPVYFSKDASQAWGNYYAKKSKIGSGIPGYRGDIDQRGRGLYGEGFWDSIVRFGLPIVKYLGPKIANTFIRASSDAIQGENFMDSLKKQGKSTVKDIASDIVNKTTSKLSGSGKRRKRGRPNKVDKPKKKKSVRRRRIPKTKLFF